MKTLKALLAALCFSLLAAGPAHAAITVLNYWHMGDNDPGAVSGGHCTNTVDAVGGHTLTNTTVGGLYPINTNGVSLAASAETGSTLALALTNGQYGTAALATSATDNFGLECWVKPGTTAAGGQILAYNGLRGNGWGLYQNGTQFEVLYGGRITFGSAQATAGTWTHLALVRNNGTAILYTNGVPASTNFSSTPITPTGSFTVGGDALFGEYFTGAIDEVRVFTFAAGAFSTNDLLLNSTNLFVSNTNDAGAGSLRKIVAQATPGDRISFIPVLSGQTITLTNGQIVLSNNVTIDASALAKGIAINGNNASRIFQVNNGQTVVLNSLTITNGNDNNDQNYGGGGILTFGTLTLTNCALAGNSATNSAYGGGGILNLKGGTLTVNQSTLAGNSANNSFGGGGGICNDRGTLTLNECTLAGNSADNSFGGGGICNVDGRVTLNQSTLAGNSANGSNGGGDSSGGGMLNIGDLMLTNSIVAANTSSLGADIANKIANPGIGAITFGGANLLQAPISNGGFLNGTYLTAPPDLAPLGNYGGPTQTMPPLPGSPAIGGCTSGTGFSTDQRGFQRIVGPFADIGAVESGDPIPGFKPVVTTTSDAINFAFAGGATLRAVTAFAANNSTITFATNLSGATITLANGQLVLSNNVTIDASALPGGIAINGNHASRIFLVTNATVTLNSLTITNGYDTTGNGGGGIYNYGATLTLNNCTLAGNSAASAGDNGGGMANYFGAVTLNQTTLADNSASGYGGGIFNYFVGNLTLTNSTLAGNSSDSGGAIASAGGTNNLAYCTLSGNSCTNGGGGIIKYGLVGAVNLTACILAGNTDASGSAPDLSIQVGTPTTASRCLIGNGLNSTLVNNVNGNQVGSTASPINPLLASLGNYGGPTPSMPPSPGSTAIDAGGSSTLKTDQRGFPRVVGPSSDIGAVEFTGSPVTTTNDSGAAGSLRYASTYAPNNTTITFATHLSGATIKLTNSQLELSADLTIDASALPGGITLNGNHASRIFQVNSGSTVVLNSLTFTNGYDTSGSGGGGIYNNAGAGGSLTVNNCTFAGNATTFYGGGIRNVPGSTLTVNQCTFALNSATNGGGGIVSGGTTTINQSTLSQNTSSGPGGGIYRGNGTITLSNSIVAGNNAPSSANISGAVISTGVNLANSNPQLDALGNHGGSTPTMSPLPGSPAIDGCTNGTSFTNDQRGTQRIIGHYADIGAVEANWTHVVVTTAADSGPDSLRDIVTYFPAGADITFATNLSGATITLTGGQMVLSSNVTINASGLPGGITINGRHASRIFTINNGAMVTLNSLVLSNGYASSSYGGAISNSPSSTAVISNCYVVACSADNYGGGILNNGVMYLNNSTLAGNHAGSYGGGLNNDGAVTVNQCTIAGNLAIAGGGGISSGGQVNLIQSTVSANTAGISAGGFHNGGTLFIYNSIVAGNALVASSGSADLDSTYNGVMNQIGGSVQLAGLGFYGGPTPTMPPLPGSSLINAGENSFATANGFVNDQRGFPRFVGGTVDLGAVEVQAPAANPPVLGNITRSAGGGSGAGAIQFTFTNTPHADFTVLTSTNVALPLTNWTVLGEVIQVSPGQYEFTDPQAATNHPRRFYRVRSP